mgnify:CR=1 FL=1
MTSIQKVINKSDKYIFWSNKEILASFYDDELQYFCYILKISESKDTYNLLLSSRSLLDCMEIFYDKCLKKTSTNLIEIAEEFIGKINNVMYKLHPPLHIKIASPYILKNIKDNFLISKIDNIKNEKHFPKEMCYRFEIDFGSCSNSESDSFDIMDELNDNLI